MATVPLIVNNTTFNYPGPGEDPGWGEDATAWAQAVTQVLNSLLGPGDLLETTFNVGNDVSVEEDVVGLTFDTAIVRAAIIEYTVYRVSDGSPSGNAEFGTIVMVYDNSASAGNKWIMVQDSSGDAGINLSVLDSGQIQYTSSDIGTTNYTGIMKFKARTLSQ